MASRKRKKKKDDDSISYSLNWVADKKGVDLTRQLYQSVPAYQTLRVIEGIDYIDLLVDLMDEYPDAEDIIKKVRRNISE